MSNLTTLELRPGDRRVMTATNAETGEITSASFTIQKVGSYPAGGGTSWNSTNVGQEQYTGIFIQGAVVVFDDDPHALPQVLSLFVLNMSSPIPK